MVVVIAVEDADAVEVEETVEECIIAGLMVGAIILARTAIIDVKDMSPAQQ